MGWNYRVIKRTFVTNTGNRENQFGIYEVYYNDDGKPISCTSEPVEPVGETLEEFKKSLESYTAALTKPVLEYEDF